MQKLKKLIIPTLSFVLGVGLTLLVINSKYLYSQIKEPLANSPHLKKVKRTKPTTQLTIGGWIPEWGNLSGLETLNRESKLIFDVSPVFYSVNSDGTLKDIRRNGWEKIVKSSNTNDIRLTPSIALFEAQTLTTILNNEDLLQKHVDSIVEEVVNNDYEGIDLDYESTFRTDKAELFIFLNRLADELHKNKKVLSFTAIPKWGDNVKYQSFPQTRYVQDYTRIGKVVDELRIMAYDYTFQGALYPGPIAPMEWVESIAKYAAKRVAPGKLVLAGRLYAYEWPYDPSTFKPLRPINENPSAVQSVAKAYTYSQVQNIIKNTEGRDIFDYTTGENIYIYKNNKNEDRIIFYTDSRTLNIHKSIARKYHFKGVAYWRFGGEKGLSI